MAEYDEDAVMEALRRVQPALDAIEARIKKLEESGGGKDLTPTRQDLHYADGTVITFERKS